MSTKGKMNYKLRLDIGNVLLRNVQITQTQLDGFIIEILKEVWSEDKRWILIYFLISYSKVTKNIPKEIKDYLVKFAEEIHKQDIENAEEYNKGIAISGGR
jgi:hypothetical protein